MEPSKYSSLGILLMLVTINLSCERKDSLSALNHAEALMKEMPDSTLNILNQIESPEKLPADQYALWCLLTTQAWDKNYMDFPTDSLIQIAIDYYEAKNIPERLMQAYYYKAVYHYELGDAIQAQDYYLKALEYAELIQDVEMIGKVCGNIGTLYTYLNMLDFAMQFQEKSLNAFELLADSINMSMVMRNMGRIYSVKKQIDDAIVSYLNALAIGRKEDLFTIFNELAYLYIEKDDHEKSYYYSEMALNHLNPQMNTFEDSCQIYLSKGFYYSKINNRDSALYYLNICKESSNIYTAVGAYQTLAELEESNNNWQDYAFYKKQHELLNDSLQLLHQAEQLAHIQGLYNYRNIEKKKEVLEEEVNQRKADTNKLSLVIVFCILGSIVVFLIEKQTRKKILDKKDKDLRFKEQEYRQSQQYLQDREEVISRLERIVSTGLKELDNTQKQLIITQRKLLEAQKDSDKILSDDANTKGNFYSSIFYTRLYSTDIKMQDSDWEEIAAWLDVMHSEFTYRLKVLYPAISTTELRICYLVKINIPVRQIAFLLNMTSQAVSQNRKRLFAKITGKTGSAKDFDLFISEF